MANHEVSAEVLKQELGSVLLLDVLPADAHEEWRIPGSKNACVYEVTFLDQVESAGAKPDSPIVVYGSGGGSLDSMEAAQRLTAAGYGNVRIFGGGRVAWREAGLESEGSEADWVPQKQAPLSDGTYRADPERCRVDWAGRNIANSHWGTVNLTAGSLQVQDGNLTGGEMELDMRTIEPIDLVDEGPKKGLIAHLESEDFFAVERFPTAHIEITAVETHAAAPGRPNCRVQANLTLRGNTEPIEFAATVAPSGENELAVQANFDIDRTRWGVNYGSGRLFHRLGMHLVNDLVSFQVRVLASTG
jgi:polyisoprenoid-binding protein YceI